MGGPGGNAEAPDLAGGAWTAALGLGWAPGGNPTAGDSQGRRSRLAGIAGRPEHLPGAVACPSGKGFFEELVVAHTVSSAGRYSTQVSCGCE